jgi:hypothetical protein
MSRTSKTALAVLAVMMLLTACGVGYWRWKYPYGRSHSCDKGLMFALDQYAQDHGGAYPAGQETPAASLSLLYPKYADAYLLSGKTVPPELVRMILERGELLGPDTCGWHYVEGLTLNDDRKIALFWDKEALGHNGERTSDGGRMVMFVNVGYDYIPGSEWESFLQKQATLHKVRNKKRQP